MRANKYWDRSDLGNLVFLPGHPAADSKGYVSVKDFILLKEVVQQINIKVNRERQAISKHVNNNFPITD